MPKLGDNLSYQGKKPNFDRDQFESLAEMRNYPETSIDEGHSSYCVETGKRYEFSLSNPINPTTGRWRLEVDTAPDTHSENSLQNKVITTTFATKEELLEDEEVIAKTLGKVIESIEWIDVD